jgi:predicted amidophosphoribosyltransferase
MSDESKPLNFEEHRRKRDENPSLVPCARCGKRILATATRCPECGVHFQGEAQEFTHVSEREAPKSGLPMWVLLLAVLLLFAMLFVVVGLR